MEVIRQWKRWSDVSTNRKIFSAALVIAVLTFSGKLVGGNDEKRV